MTDRQEQKFDEALQQQDGNAAPVDDAIIGTAFRWSLLVLLMIAIVVAIVLPLALGGGGGAAMGAAAFVP